MTTDKVIDILAEKSALEACGMLMRTKSQSVIFVESVVCTQIKTQTTDHTDDHG
jgi:hypothetical protein